MAGRDSKSTEAEAADGFPDDPLAEILSRLPAKPLFRFKCVSQGWCHLITDRLGLGRSSKFPQTLEGFFVGVVNGWRFINLSGKSVPLVDASFSFLTKLPGIKQISLLSSGNNGLLLFLHFLECHRYEYIVCNPATEQWLRVPGPHGQHLSEHHVSTFLIYDPAISSHFHLLQFRHWEAIRLLRSAYIFSSETGVWRDSTEEWGQLIARGKVPYKLGCVDVNGMLHVPFYLPRFRTHQIAVVDRQGKTSKWIHWPDTKEFHAPAFLGQSQGHLHCITAHTKQEGHLVHITGLSVWVLEDYDTRHWILKQNMSSSQLFGEMSCGVDDLDVITIHPDRNLVFFIHRCSLKLMSYDMDCEEVHHLCTLAHGCELVIPYVPYFADVPVLSGTTSTDLLEGQPTTA